MAELIGFTAISLVSLITLVIALRYPGIRNILILALIIRVIVLILGHYFISLPGSNSDAIGFENRAWDLGQKGITHVLRNFQYDPFTYFSWLLAIPYSIFGRSILMVQSISLLFGIGTIFFSWKLAILVSNKKVANLVAIILSIFPSVVLYSILVLREVYVSFFIILAMYGTISWLKNKNYKYLALSAIGFLVATSFHGAMILGGFLFLILVLVENIRKHYQSLIKLRLNLNIILIFIIVLTILGFYLSNRIDLAYVGTFKNSFNLSNLFELQKTINMFRGSASWPEWTFAQSEIDLLYKIPIRMIYFVFSPFVWEISEPNHFFGLIDSLIYLFLVFLIIKNIKIIWKKPYLRFILIVSLSYIFIFSFGVGNFGTSIRHKTKFVALIIILAAPFIQNLLLKKRADLKFSKSS